MAICAKRCENAISENDSLKCSTCGLLCHQECSGIQKQLCQGIIRWKPENVQYKCDKCLESENSMMKQFDRLQAELKRQEKVNEERFNRLLAMLEARDKSPKQCLTNTMDQITYDSADGVENDNTWSTVVKRGKKFKKSDPAIIITPNDALKNRNETKKSLKNKINPSDINVKGWSNASNNAVVVRCENDDDCDKLLKEITQKFGDDYQVKKPVKRMPRFKMLKVDNPIDDDDDFIKDLKRRNTTINDDKFKFEIIKREQVRIKGKPIEDCYNIVMQTNGEAFNAVMSGGTLKTSWNVVRVVDNVYLRRCYKCYGFNHIQSECKDEKMSCSSCSLPHLKKDCKSRKEQCINCIKVNKIHKDLKLDINHNVWSKECAVYKRKLAISRRAINYID